MCFWVEREVLEERSLKLRSDTVGFFIRVAKVSPSHRAGSFKRPRQYGDEHCVTMCLVEFDCVPFKF